MVSSTAKIDLKQAIELLARHNKYLTSILSMPLKNFTTKRVVPASEDLLCGTVGRKEELVIAVQKRGETLNMDRALATFVEALDRL